MNIKTIKSKAKQAFRANYWACVLVAFLLSILVAGAGSSTANSAKKTNDQHLTQEQRMAVQELSDTLNALTPDQKSAIAATFFGALTSIAVISFLLRIFVFNPLQVGAYRFFKENDLQPGVSIGIIKEGFGRYGHTFGTLFLRDLFLALWSVLFVIPGIVKSYSYRLVPYLLKDEPELSATETITKSRELMNGHKWEAFVMDLSFLGWFILGILTANLLNVFWTNPYYESAKAQFYLDLQDS